MANAALQAPVAAFPYPVVVAQTTTAQRPVPGSAVVSEAVSASPGGSTQARVAILA